MGTSSMVNVSGRLELVEGGGGDLRVIHTGASGHVNILTGFEYDAVQNNGNIRFIEADGTSLVDIFGGDIVNEGTVGNNKDRIDVLENALVNIYGYDFVVDGEAVLGNRLLTFADMGGATTIQIEGTLWDGTPFNNPAAISDN
ncbi:MAG: hypothetical protein JRJ84_25305, partial [Deltaproteobacteria bacterium]|nr:hypothetical protein [Deltaproteobacteria bacterium]